MGMPVSIDIPGVNNAHIFESIETYLSGFDDQFSSYKSDSEVSRFAAGKIEQKAISKKLAGVISACNKFEDDTHGHFSAHYGGTFDPSGYTKSLAIEDVSRLIIKSGFESFMINMGGDVYVQSAGTKTWNIGLQNPLNKLDTIGTCVLKNGAVATSGNYERGAHIINPHAHKPLDELMAVTVVGPDIVEADVYATTIMTMGKALGEKFIASKPEYQAIMIDNNAQIHQTSI